MRPLNPKTLAIHNNFLETIIHWREAGLTVIYKRTWSTLGINYTCTDHCWIRFLKRDTRVCAVSQYHLPNSRKKRSFPHKRKIKMPRPSLESIPAKLILKKVQVFLNI